MAKVGGVGEDNEWRRERRARLSEASEGGLGEPYMLDGQAALDLHDGQRRLSLDQTLN
jgi:hypothetical protein